jgi:hypothetical protein
VDKSDLLADLHFRLEQIKRTIAALEHFAQLRARRNARLRMLPPGLMRDALLGIPSSTAPCRRARRPATR